MESEGVSLKLIHEHPMTPWNDLRKGDCCGCFEAISDGYYCKICDFFVHKKCGDSASIEHPSHSIHTLQLQSKPGNICDLCGKRIVNLCYRCKICDFDVDLYCAKYPPPDVIEISETHHHKLTLLKEVIEFNCDANKCGKPGFEFPYKCHKWGLAFHVDCVWNQPEAKHPLEVNHSYHPLHPLKLHKGQPPDYSDGKCRLCSRNINRHDHRVSRTFVLGVVNSVCGVCRQKVDWTWGGYSCQKCPHYVVHSKCATRDDVWNGKELEGIPEETEDIEPYVVIDDNTIQHFSHKEHYMRFHVNGLFWEENKRCSACTIPFVFNPSMAVSIVITCFTKVVLNILERSGMCYTTTDLL